MLRDYKQVLLRIAASLDAAAAALEAGDLRRARFEMIGAEMLGCVETYGTADLEDTLLACQLYMRKVDLKKKIYY